MRKKNTELLSDIIQQFLKEQRLDRPLHEQRLIAGWSVVLGKNVMQYTSDLSINKRVLYVQMTSAALRHELFLSREEIKNALNKHVGAEIITEIIFR